MVPTYAPGPHAMQSNVPCPDANVPAGQRSHMVRDESMCRNLPAAHAVHDGCPPNDRNPPGHRLHAVWAIKRWYVPGAQ